MRDKSMGRDCDPVFVPRKWTKFQIGPNTHPRKVVRWMTRAKATIRPDVLVRAAARHVHPRHKRVAA